MFGNWGFSYIGLLSYMLIAAFILGIGHIGIHIQHKKSIDIEN